MYSTEFLLTSLVVVLIPGTGVIYTISTALFSGARASIAAAMGCTLGIVPHLLASVMGLAAILHLSALAFQTIKYAGVAYLIYLAWSMWRETGQISFSGTHKKKNLLKIALRGILINILNPKLSIFFLAFLPQFVPTRSVSPTKDMLLLSGIFMALTLVIFIIYGLCAHLVRAQVVNSPKRMISIQRSFAVVFAILGIKLALSEK